MTDAEKLADLAAENAALREEMSKAWKGVAKAQKHIEDAEGGIHVLTVMLESMLRQYRYGVRNAELDNAVDRYFSDKADRR